jgi:hypothetical protein
MRSGVQTLDLSYPLHSSLPRPSANLEVEALELHASSSISIGSTKGLQTHTGIDTVIMKLAARDQNMQSAVHGNTEAGRSGASENHPLFDKGSCVEQFEFHLRLRVDTIRLSHLPIPSLYGYRQMDIWPDTLDTPLSKVNLSSSCKQAKA